MKWIMALLVAGILLLGCAQTEGGAQGTGGGAAESGGAGETTGDGGQIVGVGETTGGTGETAEGGETGGAETGGDGGATIEVEAPTPSEGDVTVYMRNSEFVPQTVTVRQGQTVYWVNEDDVPHTVRMIGVINSPYLAKGGAPFWHTFTEEPGTYEYSCGILLSMRGTVIVTE